MGYQQTSPPSSPSSGRNKGRRPTSLAVGASPPAAPSKASPTGGARAPPSPTPSKASPSRSSPPKRTGSIGKGSASPARPTTKTQGPMLATEARSKVRPCGCSRRHGGGGHHHASPEPPKDPSGCHALPIKKPSVITSWLFGAHSGTHLHHLAAASPQMAPDASRQGGEADTGEIGEAPRGIRSISQGGSYQSGGTRKCHKKCTVIGDMATPHTLPYVKVGNA
ncbi:uncharacterized protein LOC134768445 [Penaeus indicus]|uniref:uncharacterized protein LOC134768445 n=1 Tax=Penaeus indicus TaxID=29960 RepID=UPI00300D8F1E